MVKLAKSGCYLLGLSSQVLLNFKFTCQSPGDFFFFLMKTEMAPQTAFLISFQVTVARLEFTGSHLIYFTHLYYLPGTMGI